MKFSIDIPTYEEYSQLCKLTGERESLMHWRGLYSWVNDTYTARNTQQGYYGTLGIHSARYEIRQYKTTFSIINGYRPVFDCETMSELPSDLNPGDIIVIGSLYMDDTAIPVPQEYDAETVVLYKAGAKLTLREPLNEPDTDVWGIYIGNDVFIADRPILKRISITDIEKALKLESR